MIPIGDVNPRRHFPLVTVLIIGLNVLVFVYQLMLPDDALERFVFSAGMVPLEVTHGSPLSAARSLVTSAFLHGGWTHIIGNMLYLWIFGDNVEEHFGAFIYAAFYLLAAMGAGLAQVAANPTSDIPTIGASGAVAGVLGAYLVLFPRTRIRTLVFVFRFARLVELPAVVVLGFWFVLQLFSGVAAVGVTAGGGVAWFAHIGGFLLGLVAGLVLKRKQRIPRYWT